MRELRTYIPEIGEDTPNELSSQPKGESAAGVAGPGGKEAHLRQRCRVIDSLCLSSHVNGSGLLSLVKFLFYFFAKAAMKG